MTRVNGTHIFHAHPFYLVKKYAIIDRVLGQVFSPVLPVSRNRMTQEQNDPPVKIYQVILNPQSL